MRAACLVLLASLFTTPVAGQRAWTVPQQVGAGLMVTAIAADAVTTMRNMHVGGREYNPLLGQHPSDFRIIGTCVVGTGVSLLVASIASKRRQRK